MKSKKSGEKQLKPAKSQNKIISWVLISVTKAFGHHVLLLPATVLRTPTNPLTYGLHTKTETHKGSLKLWIEIWNASQDTVLGLFLLIAWVMQCQTISKPRKYLASVPNKNKQKQAQQLDALLLSTGLLWDHRPRLKTKVVPSKVKGKNCKLLQYSSMDKSWGQGHLPHSPWSWMERCRLPWSRHLPSGFLECNCNIKHQLRLETSYPLVETMPTQPLSKCMLLACAYQSARQRSMGIAEKNLRRFLTTIWQRKAVWKTLLQNKSSGTINPVYLPRKLLNTTKNVSIKKAQSITNLAHDFLSCNLGGTFH